MATNLLNGSIYDYYGISNKLSAMDLKNDPYAENQWNYYSSIFSGPFGADQIFGGSNPFIESYSNYGIKNPLDAVALGLWQSGLEQASGSPYTRYRTGGGVTRGLAASLYTLSDTHLDSLNYDDKWLRTQAGAVMNASNLLKQYITRDNGDGTYNLTINPGADLGLSGSYVQRTNAWGSEVDNPDMWADTTLKYSSGPRSSVNYENVKLFNDIDAAYNYVRNESSFLYDIKKAALERTASNTDIGPTGEQARRGRTNVAAELGYASANDLKNRRSKVDQYKRNKASSQRLSATSAGGSGIGGSNDNDELKLGIPNLLGL